MRAVCKAQVTVLRSVCARIAQKILLNANDFLLNANQTDGADDGANGEKGAKAERGAARRRGSVEKGRRGEGAARRRVGAEKGRRGEGSARRRSGK